MTSIKDTVNASQPSPFRRIRRSILGSLITAICVVSWGDTCAVAAKKESPASEVLSTSALTSISQWFSTANKGTSDVPLSIQSRTLTKDQVQGVRRTLWQAYSNSPVARELAALLPDPYRLETETPPTPQACRLATGDKVMPFYFMGKGDLQKKRPLFIALHGGGSAGGRAPSPHGWSVNTREWAAQTRLSARVYPTDALYFVPRMADDNEGRWYYHYCQDAYDKVIRAAILHHQVDPNRVYLIGISEGAYTAYRMGAFMADRWAGAGSMAGGEPLGNAPPENMRNLAFRADIGENDTMFDRIGLNERYGQALENLKQNDPDGYVYKINVQAGRGHGIDYKPCPEWLTQYRRNPWPSRVTWKVINVHGRRKGQFYWLAMDQNPSAWPCLIDARIDKENNTVHITVENQEKDGTRTPTHDVALRVYLNDQLLDLDKPVRIVRNGETLFNGMVHRRLEVMMKSLAERGDPSYVFPVEINLPSSSNVKNENQGDEQKLMQMFPKDSQPYLTRLLQRAKNNREQVAGAMLAIRNNLQPATFAILSQMPEQQLLSLSKTALIEQIETMAPLLLQETDRRQRRLLARKLFDAGSNMPEIAQTLRTVKEEHKEAAAFLLTNMPQHDLTSLSKAFLIENIELSYQAWKQSPWHRQIPEQLFLQYILPYASLNERRDNWRQAFMDRLQEKAWSHTSPMEATIWLNNELNDLFEVYFHATKRPKADQSPFESIEAGYASCTGLSILLVDACRSVGIPARIVGVPLWTEVPGNHNWVEVWDGQWHNVGGTGSDPRDDDWVNKRCVTQTDPDQWRHMVYAACFRQTSLHFPLVWDFNIQYVDALNVTRFYANRQDTKIDIPGDGQGVVEVYWAGEIIARATGQKQVSFTLAIGNIYQIHITTADGKVHKQTVRL